MGILVCGASLPPQPCPSLRLHIDPSSRLRGDTRHQAGRCVANHLAAHHSVASTATPKTPPAPRTFLRTALPPPLLGPALISRGPTKRGGPVGALGTDDIRSWFCGPLGATQPKTTKRLEVVLGITDCSLQNAGRDTEGNMPTTSHKSSLSTLTSCTGLAVASSTEASA